MKTKLLLLLSLTVSYYSMAQNVNIPDAAFKATLVGNSAINTNGDSEIQVSEATAFSGSFNAVGLGIADLTGIEAFVNLAAFSASNNMITSVDLSQNTSLVEVRLVNNQLTSIDVSQLTDLIFLQLSNNPITSIDISNNPDLENLLLNNGQLTTIDATSNLALRQLGITDNQLTSINVTGLTMLTEVLVARNQITSIDLSTNTQLNFVRVDANSLTNFNMANGNNANITTFFADLNPNLSCINIDAGFTPPGTWFVDATASFSSNCPAPASIIYVDKDATGNNDGTSWQDAYADLNVALSNLNDNDEVWVAEGVYNPVNRTTPFTINNTGIKIYGGFLGTETQLSDRVFGANETIFSADIANNDGMVRPLIRFASPPSNKSDNSFNVFLISSFSSTNPTVFDGVSITHAWIGSGVRIQEFSTSVPNLEFRNCQFKYNGSPRGSAVRAENMEYNSTTDIAKFTFNQCVFEKNAAFQGAGFYASTNSNASGTIAGQKVEFTFSNSLFEGNQTGEDINGTPTAPYEGSAYYITRSSDRFDFTTKSVNNTFVNNLDAGGFTTSISSGNSNSENKVEYRNNIFWNNTNGSVTSEAFNGFLTSPTIFNCLDLDGFSNIPSALTMNIVTADPLFVDAANADFGLNANSPALNSGGNTFVIGNVDLLNNNRIESTTVDMGAYERPSCVVTIPNAVFKSALLAHGITITGTNVGVIDTNGDGEIQCDEASAYTGRLILNNNNTSGSISDLTGIEAFTNIPYILADGQSLTTLNLSSNTFLEFVSVNNNSLTSLDVSANTALIQLEVRNNSLANINVTQNVNLEILDVFGCNLTTLNISQNSVLTSLTIGNNNFSSIDMSSNVNLDSFFTEGNPNLTNIDVSSNVNLFRFEVDNTFLTDIDLSNNSILGEVSITNNANLSSVNLANGNNGSITSADFTSNPNLLCIQIDTGFTPPSTWMQDTSVIYNENCSSALSVDDDVFTQEIKIYPNPVTDRLYIESSKQIGSIEVYSLIGKKLLVNYNAKEINLSGLSRGVYLIKVFGKNNKVTVKRFIKN